VPQVVVEKRKYGLVLELNEDGRYRVLVDGAVIFESKVLAAAQVEFDEVLAQRSAAARDARGRELADFAARGVLAKANQAKAASRNAGRSRGKGG
jgi:hypothetical protein